MTKHSRLLFGFAIFMIGHWAEHIVMAYQAWVLHWPMARCLGIVGLWYPWLIRSETLHYGFALLTLVMLYVLRHGFTGDALTFWWSAIIIQQWHHFEHLLLVVQALSHHYLFGMNMPMSVLQLWVPRMQLHLAYNTAVTIPCVVAMVLHYRHRNDPDNKYRITGFVRHDGSVLILTDK